MAFPEKEGGRRVRRFMALAASLLFCAVLQAALPTAFPIPAHAEEKAPGGAQKSSASKLHMVFLVGKSGRVTAMEEYKIADNQLQWSALKGRFYASHSPFVMNPTVEIMSTVIDGKESHEHRGKAEAQLVARGPGPHTYKIFFTVRDGILFWDKHDHFAWSVQHPAPISVSAALRLPDGTPLQKMTSRMGYETVGHRPIHQEVGKSGRALFVGKEPMLPGEHFLFRVDWDSGFVTPDASRDTQRTLSLALWCAIVVIAFVCFAFWYKFGRDPVRGTVIPLFSPPSLPDGSALSPGAVNYIMRAANLTTAGFTAIIMSLAAQKAVRLSGSSSRKDPYRLEQNVRPATLSPDEEAAVAQLFSGGAGTLPLDRNDHRPGAARCAAYDALALQFRSLWNLRLPVVVQMHAAAYGLGMLVMGVCWIRFTGDFALACTVLFVAACFAALWLCSVRQMHRAWMVWGERGLDIIAAASVFCLLTPVILFYDVLLAGMEFEDYPGYAFMHSWQGTRLLVHFAAFLFLWWRMKNILAILRASLKTLQYLAGYFLVTGMLWVFGQNLYPSSLAALVLLLLIPTLFIPIMKQPTRECTDLMQKIRGFAMYIGTAETARLNVLNPPDRTPEEFTRVWPYAVALGLEKAWAAKFADALGPLNFKGGRAIMLHQYQARLSGN